MGRGIVVQVLDYLSVIIQFRVNVSFNMIKLESYQTIKLDEKQIWKWFFLSGIADCMQKILF